MSRQNFFESMLIERINFSAELALFRFRMDKDFTFRPGQYATIAVDNGNKLVQRPYSIASSPYEPFLEFYVELVPHGDLTPLIWKLEVGDVALIRNRVAGHFTLDVKSGMRHHLMSATVTGAAPFISMIRTQRFDLKRGKHTHHYHFLLIHGASHTLELGIYKDELTEIARDGWLTYIPTISRPWEDTDWKGETGRVDDLIRKYADQLGFNHTNSVGYACGHPTMIENVKGILARAHYPKEHIKDEKYFTIK
jgi:ferredoxin--NADP+ reductase